MTIAYQDTNGRSVYLGGLYLASRSSYDTDGLRTGIEDRLVEQAAYWSGIPEPSTLALLGLGLAAFLRRR